MGKTATNETTDFMKFVYKTHGSMVDNNIMLVYEGEVTQEVTKAFTSLTQKRLEGDEETNLPIKKRVYHVMVECLQNIGKHCDHIDSGLPVSPGNGIFMVIKTSDGFNVITGNPIANTKVEGIREMLDKVNVMNREEIKAYYKEKILASRISEKGGAGLGFIDIVKKTGNRIDYHFVKINDKTSFFIVKTHIN
ncbi:MAG: SiaB family protein kinase [Bacteroidota bacterium]